MRSNVRSWGLAALLLMACGDDDGGVSDSGADSSLPSEQDGAASDAAMPPTDASTSSPWAPWDGGDFRLPTEPLCVLSVAAECDGAEDCDEGVCCAEFSPSSVSYERIACSNDCSSGNQFPLCHAGDVCSMNNSLVCRQSLILPFESLGVCVPRVPNVPVIAPKGAGVAGEVACGRESCEVGKERCCLRAIVDLQMQSGGPLEPTCVGLDEPCDCDTVVDGPIDELDSGIDLDDAG